MENYIIKTEQLALRELTMNDFQIRGCGQFL